MEKDQGGSECICIWPHFVSLHPLGVTGQLVPLGEGHNPLVDDPLVPGDHWTAPVHRRIILNIILKSECEFGVKIPLSHQ